jgi:hypothetical protein
LASISIVPYSDMGIIKSFTILSFILGLPFRSIHALPKNGP